MKNDTNIYDIDGNLIRKAGDTHKFTLEEVEKMVDDLTEKVKNNPDKEIYRVYLNNAQKWLFNMYNNMDKDELFKRLSVLQNAINDAKTEQNETEQQKLQEINEAVEQLKQEYEEKPIVMDEYVPFEEVKTEE